LLKNPDCKKYIQYSEKYRATLFQGKRKLFKILKDKKDFNPVKNFKAHSVFQGKGKVAQNSCEW